MLYVIHVHRHICNMDTCKLWVWRWRDITHMNECLNDVCHYVLCLYEVIEIYFKSMKEWTSFKHWHSLTLPWLAFVKPTQSRVPWGEGTLTEGVPPVCTSVGTGFHYWLLWDSPAYCGQGHAWEGILGRIDEKDEQARENKPVSSSITSRLLLQFLSPVFSLGFLPWLPLVTDCELK